MQPDPKKRHKTAKQPSFKRKGKGKFVFAVVSLTNTGLNTKR
jgi:hypothetical protein